MKKECKDHLGNTYASKKDMCIFWNIPYNIFLRRLSLKWSIKDALTIPINTNISYANTHRTKYIDHEGHIFKTLKEMCSYWNISRSVYAKRRKLGWSVKDALTKKVDINLTKNRKRLVEDPYGNKFYNKNELCSFHNIRKSTLNSRLKKGMTMQEAIELPVGPCNRLSTKSIRIDHLGNEYSSQAEMCKYWDIPQMTFRGRINNGCSIEEALTLPKNLYIGEYYVAECLKRLNVKFYHDCTIKTIFTDLGISVDWNDFLSELQLKLGLTGYNWSKLKIQKLRPDFVIYTDEENKIRGIIEFDGEQHQNFVEFFFKTIEEFYRRSNTDFVKQSFWEYMNIPMLRIRHDQVDRIDDMVKDFIDNPQNYIHNHNTYLSEEEYWSILTKQKQQIESAFNPAYAYDNQIELEDEEDEIER